uniref:BTB domain-containing protein n=1 Tax=Glossina palpalis gambiensis TaxID=67801 RepID=A0A1B0C0K3_9MUSC
MGQFIVKLKQPLQLYSDSVANMLTNRRKRKANADSTNSDDEQNLRDSQPPKKKKLLSTTQYIYQALFKEQKNSDIAIMALSKVWNLHKVYLSQSPYFYSMFNGSWRESCQDFVHVKILDDNITLEGTERSFVILRKLFYDHHYHHHHLFIFLALDAVFGSMYSDEIEIDGKSVISILATATLFHLDGVIDKCSEVMTETINADTVITYYDAACQYGCRSVKKSTFNWLEINLLSIYAKYSNILKRISIDLMTALISSPDLYVMQTEFSLYTMLRTWIYLRLHPNYDPGNPQTQEGDQQQQQQQQQQQPQQPALEIVATLTGNGNSSDVIQSFFLDRKETSSFLATPEGQQYLIPFQALRTQYLINHHLDLKIVLNDNIIPKDWIHNHVLTHWNSILKVDHLPEEGPQNLSAEKFNENCMRCGRILLDPGYQKWRWTGFQFGLDLIIVCNSRVLSIRRHHRNEHERLLSLQVKRQFMIRASITSINSQRQPIFTQRSEITSLCLEKNEEVVLMTMDAKLVHPLLIAVNLLVVPPTPQTFKENILLNEELVNSSPISEIGANCERPLTPPNSPHSESAICIVPATPPTAFAPQNTRRSVSAASSASTVSIGSASSFSSNDYM